MGTVTYGFRADKPVPAEYRVVSGAGDCGRIGRAARLRTAALAGDIGLSAGQVKLHGEGAELLPTSQHKWQEPRHGVLAKYQALSVLPIRHCQQQWRQHALLFMIAPGIVVAGGKGHDPAEPSTARYGPNPYAHRCR